MVSPVPNFSEFNLVHPLHYAERGYPHETWEWLRKNDPVYYRVIFAEPFPRLVRVTALGLSRIHI